MAGEWGKGEGGEEVKGRRGEQGKGRRGTRGSREGGKGHRQAAGCVDMKQSPFGPLWEVQNLIADDGQLFALNRRHHGSPTCGYQDVLGLQAATIP